MKVSGASLRRGGWAAETRRGCGKGAAGLQPQFRLWSLSIRGGEPQEGRRGMRNPESARGCSCLARPAGFGLGRFAFCQQVQGGLKETIGRKLQNVRREGDQPRKKSRRSGDCGRRDKQPHPLPLPHPFGTHGARTLAEEAVLTSQLPVSAPSASLVALHTSPTGRPRSRPCFTSGSEEARRGEPACLQTRRGALEPGPGCRA